MTDRILSGPAQPAMPVLTKRDVLLIISLPAMTLVAWCVPERGWDPLCRMTVRLAHPFRRVRRMQNGERIDRLLGGRQLGARTEGLVEALAAHHHEARLQILRCHRIGKWRPHLELAGREHIDQALAAGRGGILWVLPSAFADLMTKMTLHAAGFPVAHLSRRAHGFSPSRFGAHVLNPIWTAVERRYLAQRLVMSPGRSAGALKELVRQVRENRLVSISVHSQGQRIYELPFFNATIRLADGAAVLAQTTGAALLPVYTARTGAGTFVTTVEPPLQVSDASARQDRVRSLLVQCTAVMESYVLRWPDQFSGWELSNETNI